MYLDYSERITLLNITIKIEENRLKLYNDMGLARTKKYILSLSECQRSTL